MQEDALKKMREPFAENQVGKMCRSTKKDNPKGSCPKCKGYHGLPAIQLDYVGHAAITDRLLSADPEWTWEPLALTPLGLPVVDADGGMWIKLTVGGVTRLGYGDAGGKSGGDAMKERIGDALRNAAMRFGAALDLWHKGELHVAEPEQQQPEAGSISVDQLLLLNDLIVEVGANKEQFCKFMKVEDLTALPATMFDAAQKALELKRKKS